MTAEAWLASVVVIGCILLGCPWWTRRRTMSRLLQCRTAWRGRHRFQMPQQDAKRVFVGAHVPFGRLVGQVPDSDGEGGWIGRVDLFGSVRVDRWIEALPPP